jgi:prepilin-type N-terminal cleavage/methylation domain-containing protein
MNARKRSGFTLVELLISMTVALVVITGATSFSVNSWKTRRGWTVREGVDRGARFVGLSLARDVQEAGISIESTPTFASLGTFGDTISILSVPYEPTEAPVYSIVDDGDTLPTYPPGGNCGATCIEFLIPSGTLGLASGNLAILQVGSARRLLLLQSVANMGSGRFRVTFLDTPSILGRQSGLDSLLLSRSGTTIQKLNAVVYWRNPSTKKLYRATSLSSAGTPNGQVMATNVENFEAHLLFINNSESASYNGIDSDTLNDGNDIVGAKIRAQMKSDRSDPAVNGGQPILRWYEWKVAPRNLLYEKNRTN